MMDKDSSKDEKSFGIRIWRFCALVLLFVGVVSKLLFPEPIVVPFTYSDVRLFAIFVESVRDGLSSEVYL